ncbi:MAG: hypothetical protein IPI22_11285 [Bacteroidetes bacterium]|nr:hypothetical protein [Bacteroidota bacterium]
MHPGNVPYLYSANLSLFSGTKTGKFRAKLLAGLQAANKTMLISTQHSYRWYQALNTSGESSKQGAISNSNTALSYTAIPINKPAM